jgi:hypothetical protein
LSAVEENKIMKSKEEQIINLNIDGRIFIILAIIGILLILAKTIVGAQEEPPLTTNSIQEQPAENPAESNPITVPDQPPSQSGDLVYTTNGEWIPRDTLDLAPNKSSSAEAITASSGGGQHFYLTDANSFTDEALTACASGYHMASFWEILDVSNLTYDYDHPDAHTKDDSGFGPPSFWHGWVRTGQDSSGSTTTGTGNCLNWSSRSGANSGVSVRLSRTWETAPGDIFTWDANTFACSIPGPVWCVRD